MSRSENYPEISRRQFLVSGILFFIFSSTLFIYRGSPFVLSFFSWSWQAPTIVSDIIGIVQWILFAITIIIWLSCLVGVFSPKTINLALFRIEKYGSRLRGLFNIIYFYAIFINFIVASLRALVGVAKQPWLFYVLFLFAIVWMFIIAHYFPNPKKK